jgi:hypothetical protein
VPVVGKLLFVRQLLDEKKVSGTQSRIFSNLSPLQYYHNSVTKTNLKWHLNV